MQLHSKTYNIPESLDDLFLKGNDEYDIKDHSYPLWTPEAMEYFLESLNGFKPENLLRDDKNTIYISNQDSTQFARVHCMSRKEGFSHSYVVEMVTKQNNDFIRID